MLSTARVSLQIFFSFTFIVFTVSGVKKVTVTPDRGTTLNISSSQDKGSVCKVCTGAGRTQRCSTSVLLEDTARVVLEFHCARPQDVFTVEIARNIECTTKSCSSRIIQDDAGSLPLLDFKRKFTWNLRASGPKALHIDFTKTGLTQINPSVGCPDRHTYTLQAFEATGNVAVGKYCRTGTISSAQILNQGSFSLEVPAGQKLQNAQFDVSVGEEIKSLAKIKLTLPQGTSSSELLSPNYPDSFPDDDVMEWYIQVPAKQALSVQFQNLTQPRCLKKETAAEYHSKGIGAMVRSLTEVQPTQHQNFSLTLRNCEMDRRRSGSPGLSLSIKVSTKANPPVSCSVDLRRQKGLSVHIEKLRPACEMKMNSVKKESITVPSDSVTQLSFQDCLSEDLKVTTMAVIGCNQLKDCHSPVSLLAPSLPSCLSSSLSSVTWALRAPQFGTVELTSSVRLKQSLPGQPCNDSVIKLAEEDGTTVGLFCPQGAIQKIQIHNNVSVSVSRAEGKALTLPLRPMLTARLMTHISESYVFTVSPMKDTPVLLATPGWPVGMASYSTVSWIVSLPPKMEANLMFANLSQPKCNNRHTNIRVQRVGRLEEDYSRREDEEAESEISVSESFYLNMSNCMPERGEFSVITKITLQKSKNLLLTVILSVVAALLVIFVIVLVVVCVVIRKKKKKLDHQVSIYNPNGASFLPGPNGFPKSSEDNECHVYATIEDTLVYTHLLKKGEEMGVYKEFNEYHNFPKPTDSQKPLVSRDSSLDNAEVGVYQPFRLSAQGPPLPNRPPCHATPMVDNEIYQTEDPSQEEHSPELGLRMDPEGGN